jgi:hypothetical protein
LNIIPAFKLLSLGWVGVVLGVCPRLLQLGRLLEAFVFEEHLAEAGWACAPAALLSHGDVLNGDSNGFVDEGREFDAVAAMLLPCIQVGAVLVTLLRLAPTSSV